MTIQQRPTPIRPTVESFGELQQWIDRRLENIEQDLADDETVQSVGSHVLKTKRAELLDVAWVIRDAVAAETADQATADADESVEQRFKDAYGPDADKLAAYNAEGR